MIGPVLLNLLVNILVHIITPLTGWPVFTLSCPVIIRVGTLGR
jgi:hypothetical protein